MEANWTVSDLDVSGSSVLPKNMALGCSMAKSTNSPEIIFSLIRGGIVKVITGVETVKVVVVLDNAVVVLLEWLRVVVSHSQTYPSRALSLAV